jgi:excisionase family DNA binding protein
MHTIDELRRFLQQTFDAIDGWCRYGKPDFYTGLEAAELAEESQRLACRFGYDMEMTPARTPQEALRAVGKLLAWADRPFAPPEIMTAEDAIRYLRLDVDGRDPAERLRNLVRRQGLPAVRRGQLQLFRKVAVDEWLAQSAQPEPALLTVKEAAERLGVSGRAVYDLVSRGLLPCKRIGTGRGTIRVAPQDLESYLQHSQQKGVLGWPFSKAAC